MDTRKMKQLLFAGMIAIGCAGTALTVQAAGQAAQGHESEQPGTDTWITTKVKADLMTEKGVPGSDIKVETNKGVVSLSSDVAVTDSQKEMAVAIAKKIKGVQAVSADGLKSE